MRLIDTDVLIDHFLIAATAFVHHGEVVTRNTKHYPMIDIIVTTPYLRGNAS